MWFHRATVTLIVGCLSCLYATRGYIYIYRDVGTALNNSVADNNPLVFYLRNVGVPPPIDSNLATVVNIVVQIVCTLLCNILQLVRKPCFRELSRTVDCIN